MATNAASASSDKIRLDFWSPVYGNWIISKDPDTTDISFDTTKKLTLLAEELGFATVLLVEHSFNPFDPELDQQDAWTTSAALAALVKNIELMPAVRPAIQHPAVVAKMASRIDEISGGRSSLNLVSGWLQREWKAMGPPPMPHDDRCFRS